MEKIIIKFGDIKIEKQKTYFNKKIQILIKYCYVKRLFLVKKDLNISWATQMLKKIDLYVYFSEK